MISMPLGEKLWEQTTRPTGQKVTASEKGIQEEITFIGEIKGFGRLQGIDGRIIGTNEISAGKASQGITTGTASGVLALGDEFVSFEAQGLARFVKQSPRRAERVVCLFRFMDAPTAPTDFSWMLNVIVLWEADTDPARHIVTATAYEWL